MNEQLERGALYIVSTPIGNLDDITRRAIGVLGAADLIAAEDTRKTKFLLDHLSIAKPLVSYFSYNEHRRIPELIDHLRKGRTIALVTDAGTPGISDPAYALIREAVDRGIRVIPIPGASALLAALIVSGLPTDRFVFEGFLPIKKGRKTRLRLLAQEERTMVIYESPHRIERTLHDVLEYFGDRKVAVVRELTKKFEEVVRGSATDALKLISGKIPRGEYVLVVAGASGSASQLPAGEPARHSDGEDPK
jgi:16S rRNA (cytidine1402-2'-O)-methyltransferase